MSVVKKRVAIGALEVVATAILFSLLDRFGSHFQVDEGISVLFPATAVSVLASMFFGAYGALGVVLGTILAPWSQQTTLGESALAGLINASEGLVPYLVFRFNPSLTADLRDMRSFFNFLLFGVTLNTALSAFLGNLLIVDSWTPRGFLVWWIADFSASLLIATPILAFGSAYVERLRKGDAEARPPRRVVNAIQITTIIILLGWMTSAALRSYLVNRLEQDRLHQQEQSIAAEKLLTRIHANFLAAAGFQFRLMEKVTPELLAGFDKALELNRNLLRQLRPLAAGSSADVRKRFAAIEKTTVSWFDATRKDLGGDSSLPVETAGGAHSLGRMILALRSDMELANAHAWQDFAAKRRRIMLMSLTMEICVLIILILASINLVLSVARPLGRMHHAVASLGTGQSFQPATGSARILEIETLGRTIEQTRTALHDRELQLRLQTEKAQQESRHKTEFLAKMSHELRTPLNSILGFSDLLLEQEQTIEPRKRASFLQNISRSGNHLLHLINDLLDIAKVESGRVAFEYSNFDLRTIVQSSVASITPMFRQKNQSVEVELPAEPLIVRADPGRIEQVLLNLLANAQKFSGPGDRIVISAAQTRDECEVEVRDSGIGIRPEDHERIFEEFEQVSSSEGTGLGLALARRFVEAQGGTITVKSDLGSGSIFRITLPRATGQPSGLS